MQLVKPKTKYYPTLTLDKYFYGDELHIIAADSSNTTFQKS